jgi:hypothetical protein
MFEDGTIEYEFFYRPGESIVYPALDRRAWILDPQGVQTHWVTDGNFERNGLDPLNRTDHPRNRRGPNLLPLKPDDWNQARLTLSKNQVQLSLNGEIVYHDTLEATNLRTFGYFYWCDQSEARIRNVVWRGDWPRAVPPVESQELAGPGTRWLDERLPQLTVRFEHNFARQGLPANRFLADSRTREITRPSKVGLRVDLQGGRGYTPRWLGPNLQVGGDFDLLAEFGELELSGNAHSSTGSYLMLVFDDPEVTHAGIYRGRVAKPHTPVQVVVQTEFNRSKPTGIVMDWPGSTAEESTSGTFRLARRGDTIYCLFAEADSPHFRLIHQEVVPTSTTRFDGVRLMSSTYSELDPPCRSAITWKRLAIRAEQLTGPALSQTVRPQASGILVPPQGLP